MSETTSSPEPVTGPIDTSTTPVATLERPAVVETHDVEKRRRHGKLNAVAAWVGIAAGSVFIVAVIFFTGFVLGASVGGGHHGHHGGHHGDGGGQMMHHGGGGWPGGPGGQGGFGPGPGSFGPGPGGPGGPGGFGPGAQGPGGPGGPGQTTQPNR